jgi:hypothetical protein
MNLKKTEDENETICPRCKVQTELVRIRRSFLERLILPSKGKFKCLKCFKTFYFKLTPIEIEK